MLVGCNGYDNTPVPANNGSIAGNGSSVNELATATLEASPVAASTSPTSVTPTAALTGVASVPATTATSPKPSRPTPAVRIPLTELENSYDSSNKINGLIDTWLNGNPVTLYIPQSLKVQQTVQLLVALHGMKSNGDVICNGLINFANQTGMVLLAPTFDYNSNYFDPQIIASEDTKLSGEINDLVSELGNVTHLHFKNRLLLYGFSRGAQLSHRFALLYPTRTLGVAALSAGSYTLPYRSSDAKGQKIMVFPYGVGDLQKYNGKPFDAVNFSKVSFMIEVGALDNDPEQASPAWDDYIGRSRLDRAKNFYQALKKLGINAQLGVFPNTSHQETPEMRENALKFFKGLTAA